MIKALIFDLDGTLVQTETLKAISYARAAVELGKGNFSEQDVIEAFKDVNYGKPDPEIYQLMTREFNLEPRQCLVIEDSPTGVKAASAAGMGCIAVTTDFTRKNIHESKLLDNRWVVDDPVNLKATAKRYINLFAKK